MKVQVYLYHVDQEWHSDLLYQISIFFLFCRVISQGLLEIIELNALSKAQLT